jgi:vacuolar-type H+-ATPase subunit I/STV1
MSETTTDATVDQSTADGAASETGAESATVTEGATALGDAGKKALDAMKAERNEAKAEAKRLSDEFAALKAQIEGREAEHAATLAAQAVKDEALSAANQRILKAEVRAQAASKLNDPKDALLYLDLSGFEVGEDGEVDGDAVAAAIDKLITDKPYLAAQGTRFKGEADGGARKEPPADLDGQIAAATAAGQHQLAIALKQQRAALAAHKS